MTLEGEVVRKGELSVVQLGGACRSRLLKLLPFPRILNGPSSAGVG